MVLGLLSDSHGDERTTAVAVRLLLEAGAEHLLHCGDIGSPEILHLLSGHPADAVVGNCDFGPRELVELGRAVGVRVHVPYADLVLDGVKIAVIHGDDAATLHRLLQGGDYQYLFSGHTHVAHDRRRARTRWINPGAIHRATRPSVATLDLATGTLKTLPLR